MAAPALLPLPPGEAHLWYVLEDQVKEPLLLARYEALLAPEERVRRDRYRFEKNRHEYLLTRALIRTVLSRYVPVAPAAWTFSANAHGCPAVATPEGARWLRFNLTNTAGLVACLVARDRDVGVDVEDIERHGETVQIADRFFSPIEVAELKTQPEPRQRARFFDYWTLKEAYIKARGMGLAISLHRFAYDLDPGPEVHLSVDPELGDVAAGWQFHVEAPNDRHRLALAVRFPGDEPAAFTVRTIVPG